MINSLVSIIIPTYNRASLITETLDSVIAQTYEDWECIIVDDGSTDNTEDVINQYIQKDSRFKYFKRPLERPKGGNSCRNFGFEMSRGEYVNWFDSDDIMLPEFMIKKVTILDCLNIDAVISKLNFFDGNISNIRVESRSNFSDNLLDDFLTLKITWYLPDVMWQKKFLIDKKLFDETLLAGQDREFHSRMLLKHPTIKCITDVLTLYRKHDTSLTKTESSNQEYIMQMSHYNSIFNFIGQLQDDNLLSTQVKLHYFQVLIRYYPFFAKDKVEVTNLFLMLRLLSFLNFKIANLWIKIIVAYFSFRLFNRGATLLR